jgi:HNH endonuclease
MNYKSKRHALAARFLDRLDYHADQGDFSYKLDKSVHGRGFPLKLLGAMISGSTDRDGYLVIRTNQNSVQVHRLVWLIETGVYPNEDIDHKDNVRTNNVFSNLRLCTRSKNCQNSKGRRQDRLKGAYLLPQGRWMSSIMERGIVHHLGYFDTEMQAHTAYRVASSHYHGEYGRTE